jgi:hypothetical protein
MVGIQLGCNQLLLDVLDDNRMPQIRLRDTSYLLSVLFALESRLSPYFVVTQQSVEMLGSYSIQLHLNKS